MEKFERGASRPEEPLEHAIINTLVSEFAAVTQNNDRFAQEFRDRLESLTAPSAQASQLLEQCCAMVIAALETEQQSRQVSMELAGSWRHALGLALLQLPEADSRRRVLHTFLELVPNK